VAGCLKLNERKPQERLKLGINFHGIVCAMFCISSGYLIVRINMSLYYTASLLNSTALAGGVPGIWHTTITDNATVVLLDFVDIFERPSPSITIGGLTLAKGNHLLEYQSNNAMTNETCKFQIFTKV
jgi:hypothetical protein